MTRVYSFYLKNWQRYFLLIILTYYIYAAVISFKVPCSFPNKISSTNSSFIGCILLLFLKLYQYFISPMLGNNCRFHPTCSEYAKEAILTHGNIKGLWLAFKRIIRCQPFCDGGYDPVQTYKK